MSGGAVIWLTGLPGAGKSTLARRLSAQLRHLGHSSLILDSDDLRVALGSEHAYAPDQRAAFYATVGRLAALLAKQELVVIVAATANKRSFREQARSATPRFLEVHLQTSLEECERRDAKGLYAKARTGVVQGLPGVDAEYEPPLDPDVYSEGGLDDGALDRIVFALERLERR